MTTALFETICEIVDHSEQPVAEEFLRRAAEGALTRDENPYTHFCVYFAAYWNAEVFIGHHKKSGLWLFNGGHIDKGELPSAALEREIGEEWGLKISAIEIGRPQLLTITEIKNPTRQTCTRHYDIWYFVALEKNSAAFDTEKLAKEFCKPTPGENAGALSLALPRSSVASETIGQFTSGLRRWPLHQQGSASRRCLDVEHFPQDTLPPGLKSGWLCLQRRMFRW